MKRINLTILLILSVFVIKAQHVGVLLPTYQTIESVFADLDPTLEKGPICLIEDIRWFYTKQPTIIDEQKTHCVNVTLENTGSSKKIKIYLKDEYKGYISLPSNKGYAQQILFPFLTCTGFEKALLSRESEDLVLKFF
jgi:hypothetical protein